MPGKSRKVLAKPITDFLETEEDPAEHTVDTEPDHMPFLQAISQVISKEVAKIMCKVGKIEIEFKTFRQEICTSFTNLEQNFEQQLTTIPQKIDAVELAQRQSASQVEAVIAQIPAVGSLSTKLEHNVQAVRNDHNQLEKNSSKLSGIIEQMDNNFRKNNLKLRGLKEVL